MRLWGAGNAGRVTNPRQCSGGCSGCHVGFAICQGLGTERKPYKERAYMVGVAAMPEDEEPSAVFWGLFRLSVM